jgi:hypothetical protein
MNDYGLFRDRRRRPYPLGHPIRALGLSATCLLVACGGGDGGSGSSSAPTATSAIASEPTYTIGGTISGLSSEGLTLLNGTDVISANPGDQNFAFPIAVVAGTAYAVSVQLQPDADNCTVSGGSGTVGSADVTDVHVTCASAAFTVGGTVSGLTGNGLVLANGSDTTSPEPGATAFTFPVKLTSTASFAVTIATQPAGQTCAVGNGTGVILTSSVGNIVVTCH